MQLDLKAVKAMDMSKNEKPFVYVLTQPWCETGAAVSQLLLCWLLYGGVLGVAVFVSLQSRRLLKPDHMVPCALREELLYAYRVCH